MGWYKRRQESKSLESESPVNIYFILLFFYYYHFSKLLYYRKKKDLDLREKVIYQKQKRNLR